MSENNEGQAGKSQASESQGSASSRVFKLAEMSQESLKIAKMRVILDAVFALVFILAAAAVSIVFIWCKVKPTEYTPPSPAENNLKEVVCQDDGNSPNLPALPETAPQPQKL
ncbi:MAG: hypothetical protein ACOX3T_03870 [Bdellovibrionota bacterium]